MSVKIEYLAYARKFRSPLQTSQGEWGLRRGFLIRRTDRDAVNYGEIAPLPEFGTETFEAAEAFLSEISVSPDVVVPKFLPACASGFSTMSAPLLDNSGLNKMRGYPVAALLPAGEGAVLKLPGKLIEGYQTFKWKVGVKSLEAEQAIFDQLIDLMPAGARLRLDANAAWSLADLEAWIEFLEPKKEWVEYLEQPLEVGAEAEMLRLRASSGVEIALDESLNGEEGKRWLKEWPGVVVIKAALMGDADDLREVLESLGERVVLSSVFETGIGLRNTLAFADQLYSMNRAIGFDTLHFIDALGGRVEGSQITVADREAINFEAIWMEIAQSN
jgi:O-succinylbenzoate synthase